MRFRPLSPRLFRFGAIGTAAFAISIGYFHFKTSSDFPSTSNSESKGPKEYFAKLDGHIRRMMTRNFCRLLKSVPRPPSVGFSPLGDPSFLCRLALDGVDIDRFAKPGINLIGTIQREEIEKFLKKSAWLMTIFLSFFYHLPSIYTEEELWPLDDDYLFERRLRNSREERRIAESLSQLLLQSEMTTERKGAMMANGNSQNSERRELPRLLINLVHTYRTLNKPIVLTSLKILANSVASSKELAQTVANSDWIPLLSSMLKNPSHDEERILSHKILSNILFAFGREKNELPAHLYELHKPISNKMPQIDIVFIHGLRGSAFRTWRQKDRPNERTTLFWPKDWLAVDLKESVRMIAVDYSSRFFQLSKSMETFEARAQLFAEEFKRNGIGERPIVFICHSMGGLLVKQLLLENEQLLSKTVGVLFMATPHLGTPVASQLRPYFIRPSSDVLLLQPKSEQNNKLANRFNKAAEQIPFIVTVLECKKTRVFGREVMLVPVESGIMGKGPVYHLDEGHHNVCKPESKESITYQIVFNFINDALEYVKTVQR
ncbi:hypothetical protein niasHT_010000 [Heterodera trifolii]|uniref:GPI inositol-deacylase n=1 Tax=Heterodera trifolii TaxID=157864 RepID=A0ABD2M8E7_9BILA